jgi:hypothetical protein
VAPGGSTTSQIRFDPSASGVRNASVGFANNDGNENPFEFSIRGTGIEPALPNVYIEDVVSSSAAGVATVSVATTEGAAYGIHVSAQYPAGGLPTWTALLSEQTGDGTVQRRMDGGAGAVDKRFYQVALAGHAPSPSNVWGVVRREANPGFTLISTPLRTDRRFDGEMGVALAEELHGNDGGISSGADGVYILQTNGNWRTLYLDAAGTWRESDGSVSTYELPAGQGFWIARKTGTSARITFTGPVGNNGTRTHRLVSGWNLIGLSEGKDLPLKATFAAAQPVGAAVEENADQIVLQRANGSWRRLMYVQGWGAPYDGNWFDLSTFQIVPANEVLEPGAAYYYLRRGEATDVEF